MSCRCVDLARFTFMCCKMGSNLRLFYHLFCWVLTLTRFLINWVSRSCTLAFSSSILYFTFHFYFLLIPMLYQRRLSLSRICLFSADSTAPLRLWGTLSHWCLLICFIYRCGWAWEGDLCREGWDEIHHFLTHICSNLKIYEAQAECNPI